MILADFAEIAKKQSWIVEGIYYQYGIEKVLWKQADIVIWLDLPLWLIQIRTFKRSLSRIFYNRTKPSGSPVDWRTEFGKDGLLRVLHKIHKAVRKYYPDLLDAIKNDTEIMIIKNSSDYKTFLQSPGI